jgi:hypothetical protein
MPATPDLVWNRACNGGGEGRRPGDAALAALLRFHGAAMNGGVLHAVESLDADELSAAEDGYGYFGFEDLVKLIAKAREIFLRGEELEDQERPLDEEYARHIPKDSVLVKRFEERFSGNQSDFAPIR